MTLASADPQQERLGIPTDRRLHYLLERFQKPRLSLGLRLATASQSMNVSHNAKIKQFRDGNQPAISVDTKNAAEARKGAHHELKPCCTAA